MFCLVPVSFWMYLFSEKVGFRSVLYSDSFILRFLEIWNPFVRLAPAWGFHVLFFAFSLKVSIFRIVLILTPLNNPDEGSGAS
jgi:hypothetical protein